MAFTLPAAAHIGRVTIQVASLDRSLGFYERLFGFRVVERADGPTGPLARLAAGGSDRILLEIREKPGVRPVSRRGLIGLYHFAVLLPSRPDLGRFLGHLRHFGVPVGASDHLVSEALYIVDPDGITVEVYRDRPRSEWKKNGPEFAMASDPLDLDDVVRAGGGGAHTVMPAGTTMGHMHFYVNDLATASRFYNDGLGFDRTVWTFPGALFVAAGGYHHHVGLNTWAAGSPLATHDDAKLIEWELVVPSAADVAHVADSLRAQGIEGRHDGTDVVVDDPWQITARITS